MEKQAVLEVLKLVFDPDYVDRSIVDMGLVTEDDIVLEDGRIQVSYTLTAPMCPFSAGIGLMIKYALEKKLGLPVTVKLKASHHQAEVMSQIFQDEERSAAMMRNLEEFGVLQRCVRI